MAQVILSRSRGRARSGRRSSSRTSGSTEWVASSSSFAISSTVNWLVAPVIPNSVIASMTSPTFLGGHIECVMCGSTQAPGPPAVGTVGFGIMAIPQRTLEAAQAVVSPDPAPVALPFSDAEASWPYLRYVPINTLASDQTTPVVDPGICSAARFHDVVRSKRKLSEDDALVWILEYIGTEFFPAQGIVCIQVSTRFLLRQA